MQLQPPTDNLYKFLAVGGIAAILGSIYFFTSYHRESYPARLKLEQQFAEILDEFHAKFGSNVSHDELNFKPQEVAEVKVEDSLAFSVAYADPKHVYEHLNLHHRQLLSLMDPPLTNEKTKSFWMKWYGLSEDALRNWATSNPEQVQAIQSSAIEFRPRFERTFVLAKEIWSIEEMFSFYGWCCGMGIAVGSFLTCFGFIFWYVLVQRVQDQILRLDLAEKQKKLS